MVVRGERAEGVDVGGTGTKKSKERARAEVTGAGGRGRGSRERRRGEKGSRAGRGRRGEPEVSWEWAVSEEERVREEEEEEALEQEGGTERWGRRRRLLSITEDGEEQEGQESVPSESQISVSYSGRESTISLQQPGIQANNHNQYSYNLLYHPEPRGTAGFKIGRGDEEAYMMLSTPSSTSSSGHLPRRVPRSLFSPTLDPPLSALSFFYPFSVGEEHALLPQPAPLSLRRSPTLLSLPFSPLLSSSSPSALASSFGSPSTLLSAQPPVQNDFSRKVEGFWILRELQSWLWRSAKDFNRLKKRLRG